MFRGWQPGTGTTQATGPFPLGKGPVTVGVNGRGGGLVPAEGCSGSWRQGGVHPVPAQATEPGAPQAVIVTGKNRGEPRFACAQVPMSQGHVIARVRLEAGGPDQQRDPLACCRVKATEQDGQPAVIAAMLVDDSLAAAGIQRTRAGKAVVTSRGPAAPARRREFVETQVTEIAPGIYRLSTYSTDANFMFNQFLVVDEEPLLFQTGLRSLFPLVSDAVRRVIPVVQLRWITFGHVEADECGSMNQWLAAAPNAQVAHGAMGCAVSVNDLADRPPRPLQHGEVIELGTKRLRRIETPHVPHGWDAGLFYEETTSTLLCGDLFTALGNSPALTEQEIIGPALSAEDVFRATCLTPSTGPTIRSLADLRPQTLGLMHGPSYAGDCVQALHDLASAYDERLAAEGARLHGPVSPAG